MLQSSNDAGLTEQKVPHDRAAKSGSGSSSGPEVVKLFEENQRLRQELKRLRGSGPFSFDARVREGDRLQLDGLDGPANENGSAADGGSSSSSAHLPKHRRRARLIAYGVALLAAALVVFAGPRTWRYLVSYESTDDAQVGGHVIPISSRIDGTVAGVHVDNTEFVSAGQPLVDIDPRDYRIAVEKARADLAQARAQIESARRNYEAVVARTRESQASDVKAQADAARYGSLFEHRIISRQQYEEAVRIAQIDSAAVESARAAAATAFKAITIRRDMAESQQAALAHALLNLSYIEIKAPVGGIVGKKTVEVGARIQPGQELMAIVPIDDLWVTANFRETQLRSMHPGQRATIYVDALGCDFDGYVEGMPGASGETYSLLPPENATGNYVKVVQRFPVRIRFTKGQDQEHRLRPGMSVEPKVWLR